MVGCLGSWLRIPFPWQRGLDGVRFCYLATSSRKAGTIRRRRSSRNNRPDSVFLPSSEESWYTRGGWCCCTPQVLLVAHMLRKWTVKFSFVSLSLDPWHTHTHTRGFGAWKRSHMLGPRGGGAGSSQCTLEKAMPPLTSRAKHLDPRQHWFPRTHGGMSGTNESEEVGV